MERRSFLRGLAAIVGGLALEEAIPLGRVWSFPSKIIIPQKQIEAVSIGHVLKMMESIRPHLPRLYVNENMLHHHLSSKHPESPINSKSFRIPLTT